MILSQIKPQKGKAYDDLPAKTLEEFKHKRYMQSIKYDGNQIFIVKINNDVEFFTSDWKQFDIEVVRKELYTLRGDFLLVGEFMHNCVGKLGDRVHSAILTTYRTNYSKCIKNGTAELGTNIKVFDALEILDGALVCNTLYRDRIKYAASIIKGSEYLMPVIVTEVTGREALDNTKEIVRRGWEGTMLIDPDSFYAAGKRVNYAIKLKTRKTADLLCTGVLLGEGKYSGLIGSLILKDKEGRTVNVGSGLADYFRGQPEEFFIGKVIEIEYEQILDTYIQPTFMHVRLDKVEKDID